MLKLRRKKNLPDATEPSNEVQVGTKVPASKEKSSEPGLRGEITLYVIVGLISLVCISVATALKTKTLLSKEMLAHVLLELGIAGMISLVVILTVELRSRKQHKSAADKLIKKMNKDLFGAIYKRYIPESIFGEFEDCVLWSKVVRSNYKIRYNFNEQVSAEFRKVFISHSYDIRNTTDTSIDAPIGLYLEKPFAGDEQLCGKVVKVVIGDIELSDEDIVRHTKTDAEDAVVFSYPIHLVPRGKLSIQLEGELYKQNRDVETWSFSEPTEGVELIVFNSGDAMEVRATANHSRDLRSENSGSANLSIWSSDKGFMPGQSIVFWWGPSPSGDAD